MSLKLSKITSAAVAALFLSLTATSAQAAVPVEESVEEPVKDTAESQRREVQPLTRTGARPGASRRAPSLDIPPTIEPSQLIIEEQPAVVSQNSNSTPSATQDDGSLSNLFYQLQILQQELQRLRGQVEEQNFQIKRLQQEQKDQYLDLDRRVAALGSAATISTTPSNTAAATSASQPAATQPSGANSSPPATEREA